MVQIFRHLTGLSKHGRISKGALEGSSSASLREMNTHVSTEYWFWVLLSRVYCFFQTLRRLVVTLDPNKFAEKKQKRFHIGDIAQFRPYIWLHSQSRPVESPFLMYDKQKAGPWPYPPETKAFLYYFTPPEKPLIAGELRLRVASSDDPASFESGSDLMKVNGQVWSRPLFVLSKNYISLYDKLREELLVPDNLDVVLSTFPNKPIAYRRSHLLYTLNDTFIVNFVPRQIFMVLTEQGMETLILDGLFFEKYAKILPYTGEYHISTPLD